MAKIILSEQAPTSEPITFSLASDTFTLEGLSDSYETDNGDIIANAEANPWLDVEFDVESVDIVSPEEEVLEPVVPVLEAVDEHPEELVHDVTAPFEDEDAPVEEPAPVDVPDDTQETEF